MMTLYNCVFSIVMSYFFFFFNDTATTEIYTLSLHDALPISRRAALRPSSERWSRCRTSRSRVQLQQDRKSTRLNSSHSQISYAVFCLKKKKIKQKNYTSKQRPYSTSTYRNRSAVRGVLEM